MSDAMMFGIATMPYEMAMSDEMSRRQFYANTQRLVAALEAAQMGLRREESDHERTIDQRDAAEDALGRMFQAVTGRPAEWSSAWGYVDAIEEVEEHVAALEAAREHLRDFATGKLRHVYRGGCPDQVNGPDARDPACPACQAIEAARFGIDAAIDLKRAKESGND